MFIRSLIFISYLFLSSSVLHSSQNDTQILLIRHGETDWNLENRMQGSTDNPLNATGIAQAEKLSKKMWEYHPDIATTIYSSDLQRAVETAKRTVEVFQLSGMQIRPIVTMENLREFDWGVLEGMYVPERELRYHDYIEGLSRDYPLRQERWNFPQAPEEGVETLNHLVERTKKAITEIALSHPGEKVAVFAHGRVINTLIIDLENWETDHPPSLPNCAVVHFSFNPDSQSPLQFVKVENLLVMP